MQEQPGGEDRTVKPFKITWAQPGDPIYSEGWTIGSASPSVGSTSNSAGSDTVTPATSPPPPEGADIGG